ncbi:MAG: DUF87 domain-containing protein [Oscillospiraceae bacterium]|nr:DUF87 domain-containing protein [Oscillospiraceae bacterium]MBR4199976.1 DUF87 domain-containing protein [Oscillospiraceae bacterium]
MSLFKRKSKTSPGCYEKKVTVPQTAQDTIPFIEAYDNGIFLVDENVYTLVFAFENLDYTLLREEEQLALYRDYQKLMNALPVDIDYQEFIMNDSINVEKLRQTLMPPNKDFGDISENYCEIMEGVIRKSEIACADKIMIIAISYRPQTTVDNVNVLFKYYRELQTYFNRLKVDTRQLMPEDVFRIMHRYYHPFDEDAFLLPANYYSRGRRIKDYIAPSMFAFKAKEVEVGESFTRIMYVKRYDRDLDDEFLNELTDNNFRIAVSKHLTHIDKGSALEKVRHEIFAVQTQIQKRMEKNHERGGNFIPFRLTDKLKELEELQNKLAGSTAELFEVTVLVSVSARTKEELEELTKSLKTRAAKHQVTLSVLSRQQEKGMTSILPLARNLFGAKSKNAICTYLLTEEASIMIPFSYRSYFTDTGIYYGINRITSSAVVLDRTEEMNSNGFVYGTSGSGKSIFTKLEISEVLMKYPDDEIIVIDPENEYRILTEDKNLGGEILKVSANSPTRLNIFDIDLSFTEEGKDAVALKSEFIMTIVETAKGSRITSDERSIVDRCVRAAYHDYLACQGKDRSKLPTLTTFYNLLKEQPEDAAEHLALVLELYVTGSFTSFAGTTNINASKRFLVFDIFEMGEQLQAVGLQVILEFIWQRVITNKAKGIRTWVWIDEFSSMFADREGQEMQAGKFFMKVYSRIRKHGGVATAITQNIGDLLLSPQAVSMMGNAEFTVLLQQKSDNLAKLVKIFELSPSQEAFLKTGEIGTGLLICGRKVIPFDKTIPQHGRIYEMISTKFKEKQAQMQAVRK